MCTFYHKIYQNIAAIFYARRLTPSGFFLTLTVVTLCNNKFKCLLHLFKVKYSKYHRKIGVLLVKAHILSLQDVILRSMVFLFFSFSCIINGTLYHNCTFKHNTPLPSSQYCPEQKQTFSLLALALLPSP